MILKLRDLIPRCMFAFGAVFMTVMLFTSHVSYFSGYYRFFTYPVWVLTIVTLSLVAIGWADVGHPRFNSRMFCLLKWAWLSVAIALAFVMLASRITPGSIGRQ